MVAYKMQVEALKAEIWGGKRQHGDTTEHEAVPFLKCLRIFKTRSNYVPLPLQLTVKINRWHPYMIQKFV